MKKLSTTFWVGTGEVQQSKMSYSNVFFRYVNWHQLPITMTHWFNQAPRAGRKLVENKQTKISHSCQSYMPMLCQQQLGDHSTQRCYVLQIFCRKIERYKQQKSHSPTSWQILLFSKRQKKIQKLSGYIK